MPNPAAATRESRPLLGPKVLGWGVLLVSAASAGAAKLVWVGVRPLLAAAISAGLISAGAWLITRRLSATLETRVAALTADLEAQRNVAEAREELLRTLVESTPLALLFYSDTGRIVYANAEARRLFFEGAAAEGQNFLRLAAQAPEALRRALLGDSDELFNMELAGQPETYHVSRRSFEFDGETHTLLLVRHLTREVSRREVEVLKKVIRVISHELNNSLAPVVSLVHSARRIAKTPEHLPKLELVFDTIEERARHLTAFLSGYANLAHLPKPRPSAVAWSPFLERLSALFPEARFPAAPASEAWFDAAQIEQLLINLLKNANEAGGPPKDVELSIDPAPDRSVTLQILDRGHGLTPEALESAFLPLYSTKERGSGMGLALCREVIEAHGGRVSITNRDGGGCAVTCWLPGPKKAGVDLGATRARLTLTRS